MQRPCSPGSRRPYKVSKLWRCIARGSRKDLDIGVTGPAIGNSLALGEGDEIDFCPLADRIGNQVEMTVQEGGDAVRTCDTRKCLSSGLVERNCRAPR